MLGHPQGDLDTYYYEGCKFEVDHGSRSPSNDDPREPELCPARALTDNIDSIGCARGKVHFNDMAFYNRSMFMNGDLAAIDETVFFFRSGHTPARCSIAECLPHHHSQT